MTSSISFVLSLIAILMLFSWSLSSAYDMMFVLVLIDELILTKLDDKLRHYTWIFAFPLILSILGENLPDLVVSLPIRT